MTDFLPTTPADKVEIHSNGIIDFVPNSEPSNGDLRDMILNLNAKVDNVSQGLAAVYNGLDYLIKMLSAVQQVAGMMPGMGKKIKTAMDAMDRNGSAPNGR